LIADQSAFRFCLVGADQLITALLPVFVLDVNDGAEEHNVELRWSFGNVHDFYVVQTSRQKADTPINLAQLLLAVDVLRVFGAVALGGGVGDLLDDRRTSHGGEVGQFGRESCSAPRRNVRSHR